MISKFLTLSISVVLIHSQVAFGMELKDPTAEVTSGIMGLSIRAKGSDPVGVSDAPQKPKNVDVILSLTECGEKLSWCSDFGFTGDSSITFLNVIYPKSFNYTITISFNYEDPESAEPLIGPAAEIELLRLIFDGASTCWKLPSGDIFSLDVKQVIGGGHGVLIHDNSFLFSPGLSLPGFSGAAAPSPLGAPRRKPVGPAAGPRYERRSGSKHKNTYHAGFPLPSDSELDPIPAAAAAQSGTTARKGCRTINPTIPG